MITTTKTTKSAFKLEGNVSTLFVLSTTESTFFKLKGNIYIVNKNTLYNCITKHKL